MAQESLTESQQMLRLVLDTIPVRVFWKNRQSEFLGGNQLFARDAGFDSAVELVGKTDFDLTSREEAERYRADDLRFMGRGEARFNYEEPHTTPDGRKLTVLTSKVPLRDRHNNVIGILGTYEDITERRRAEELLRLQEAALQAAANVVVITDRNGVIVWTNPAFTKVTGYTAEEALGRNPRVLKRSDQPSSYPAAFYEDLWKTITSGQVWQGEFHNNRKDGTLLIEDATITPVRNEEGEITHFVAVKQDITARKAAEVALRTSEEEFRAMFELASIGMAQADPYTGQLLRVNRKMCAITGYATDELLRLRFSEITHPDDRQRDWEGFQQLIRGEILEYGVEKRYVRKDGAVAWVNVNVTVVRDPAGRPTHSMATIEDITGRKLAQKQLAESERRLRSILEAEPECVKIVAVDGSLLDMNPAGLRMIEADSLEQIIGLSCFDLVAPEYRPVFHDLNGAVFRGECNIAEFQIIGLKGTRRWMESHACPMRDAEGNIFAQLAVSRDITARKAAEQERATLEVQLRQAQKLESIGQLAAGIAHEINTPTQYVGDNLRFVQESLAGLQSVLTLPGQLLLAARENRLTPELLAQTEAALGAADLDYLSTEIPKAIEESLEGVGRVTKIVRAMKDFSHPGSEEKTTVDLNKAIESTLTVARNEWKYVAELVTDFDPGLPPVHCLPGEFNQVILNLVVNAAHAIGDALKGRENTKGTITASTRRDGDWVEVRIRDTGTGIPESARGKMFEPFFTTKGVGKGTGQGLAIARSVVVDKHGGKIWFETESGRGTVFIIRLPIAAPAGQEVGGK